MPFAQAGGAGAQPPGPADWFKALPIVTRYWLGATMVLTLAANFDIIPAYKIIFNWNSIKTNLELWRLLTPFCYAGPFHISTVFTVYMLYQFSLQYEKSPFNTGGGAGTADYIFCLMFGATAILLTYPFLMSLIPPVFCRNLCYYVLYLWSKRNPEHNANIWGIPIKAAYLPFAYLALSVCIGGEYMDLLHGIAIGHLFYFMVDVVPVVYGSDFLRTPTFLIEQFGVGNFVARNTGGGRPVGGGGFGGGGRPAAGAFGGGHNWGGGQRLGN